MSNDFHLTLNGNLITISGHLSSRNGKELYKHLQDLFNNLKFKTIKLNIVNVSFLDSYTLGAIIFFHTILQKHNRQLMIICPKQQSIVSELFKITNLDDVLSIVNDENIQNFQKSNSEKDKRFKYGKNIIYPIEQSFMSTKHQYSEKYQLILENKELKKQHKKRCIKCKEIKDLSEFSISYCKDCTKKYYSDKNQEKSKIEEEIKTGQQNIEEQQMTEDQQTVEQASENVVEPQINEETRLRRNLINLISYYRVRLRRKNIIFDDRELEKELPLNELQSYLEKLKIATSDSKNNLVDNNNIQSDSTATSEELQIQPTTTISKQNEKPISSVSNYTVRIKGPSLDVTMDVTSEQQLSIIQSILEMIKIDIKTI